MSHLDFENPLNTIKYYLDNFIWESMEIISREDRQVLCVQAEEGNEEAGKVLARYEKCMARGNRLGSPLMAITLLYEETPYEEEAVLLIKEINNMKKEDKKISLEMIQKVESLLERILSENS